MASRNGDVSMAFYQYFAQVQLHANNIPLTIYLDTETGKHQKINITELADTNGKDYCTTIL